MPKSSEPGSKPPRVDKKLLDEIFGDVLPDTTVDEREAESSDSGAPDRWYRENTPPHHRD